MPLCHGKYCRLMRRGLPGSFTDLLRRKMSLRDGNDCQLSENSKRIINHPTGGDPAQAPPPTAARPSIRSRIVVAARRRSRDDEVRGTVTSRRPGFDWSP